MNDSPGWATPGSSPSDPSDGERPGAPADQPAGDQNRKWSAEQPPPGQWSSPAGGQAAPQGPPQPHQQPQGGGWGQQPGAPYGGQYGPQYGGQGGQYGYPGGPGQWGKPPAAKPGVIPLRPLGLGEILDGAVSTMRAHWRSVLPITLVVATVVQVISVVAQKLLISDLSLTPGSRPSAAKLINDMGSSLSVTLTTNLIQLLGTIVATAMLTMIFSRAILGQGSTITGAWREARPQLLRLIALALLLGAGAVVLVLVLLLPGILASSGMLAVLGMLAALPLLVWLGIRFSLASPALMLEKSTVFKALGRSSKLVSGAWWRIFGITILTSLITVLVAWIIVGPLTAIGIFAFGGGIDGLTNGTATTAWGTLILAGAGGIIAQTITLPIQSGVTVLLYVDQRIRREALDLELARAAGVENYGTTGG